MKNWIEKIYKSLFALLSMKTFLRKIIEGEKDQDSRRYFLRFGKGTYQRRFLISFNKGKSIKIKTSFELANDLVMLAYDLGVKKFSGKILAKEKISGIEGRKKAGLFSYDLVDTPLEKFMPVYYALLDGSAPGVTLKVKKSLPKVGKNEEKIDDGFAVIEVDPKYWDKLKETFFWDTPEGKKVSIEHTLVIKDIIFPAGEKDPVKIRELAIRKGTIIRNFDVDGNKSLKEYPLEV